MKKVFKFLSRGKILVVLLLLMLAFNLLLSFFMPKEHALDLKFAYSYDEAWAALSAMDQETKKQYRLSIWLLDFPYLLVYGSFFLGILGRLWGYRTIIFVPLMVASFDLFENLAVLRLLKIFPEISYSLTVSASVFTSLKWIMIVLMLGAVLGGIFRFITKRNFFLANSIKSKT